MPKPFQIGFTPFFVALLLQLAPPPSFSADHSYIAIIIDDIGHNRRAGERAIDIQAHLTFAVIPETQHAVRLASYAHSAGREVMVHLPMANTMNQPLGGLGLTNGLSEQDVATVLDQAVRLVPFASGINNHMGSALTQEPQAMVWLMRAVKRHKLFFVDSRTTHKSVASEIALPLPVNSAIPGACPPNAKTRGSAAYFGVRNVKPQARRATTRQLLDLQLSGVKPRQRAIASSRSSVPS